MGEHQEQQNWTTFEELEKESVSTLAVASDYEAQGVWSVAVIWYQPVGRACPARGLCSWLLGNTTSASGPVK